MVYRTTIYLLHLILLLTSHQSNFGICKFLKPLFYCQLEVTIQERLPMKYINYINNVRLSQTLNRVRNKSKLNSYFINFISNNSEL